jgi:hypothetical protein
MSALPLSLLCAGRAEAVSTIDQTISNTTLNAFSNLGFSATNPRTISQSFQQLFDKFDTSLGTLIGVRFTGDGDLTGNFRGAKSNNNTPAPSLTGGTAELRITFPTASWTTNSGTSSFIGASTLATSTTTNLGNGSGGTLLTSSGPTLSLNNSDTSTYLSFFQGGPGDEIESTFSWNLSLTSNNLASGSCSTTGRCTGFNFSPTGSGSTPRLTGDINSFTLSYDYEPFPAEVPAPLPILGSGMAFAYTRRLRRRIQKARFTL